LLPRTAHSPTRPTPAPQDRTSSPTRPGRQRHQQYRHDHSHITNGRPTATDNTDVKWRGATLAATSSPTTAALASIRTDGDLLTVIPSTAGPSRAPSSAALRQLVVDPNGATSTRRTRQCGVQACPPVKRYGCLRLHHQRRQRRTASAALVVTIHGGNHARRLPTPRDDAAGFPIPLRPGLFPFGDAIRRQLRAVKSSAPWAGTLSLNGSRSHRSGDPRVPAVEAGLHPGGGQERTPMPSSSRRRRRLAAGDVHDQRHAGSQPHDRGHAGTGPPRQTPQAMDGAVRRRDRRWFSAARGRARHPGSTTLLALILQGSGPTYSRFVGAPSYVENPRFLPTAAVP